MRLAIFLLLWLLLENVYMMQVSDDFRISVDAWHSITEDVGEVWHDSDS